MIDKEKTSLENYINSIDRLAFCILRNHLSENELKSEYRDVVFDLVEKRKEEFGVTSRYRNILKVYNIWKDQ